MDNVFILRFESDADLARAFDRILDSPDVDSCVVDAEESRLRFFAREAPGQALIERLYQDRGLVWCSRHPVQAQTRQATGS